MSRTQQANSPPPLLADAPNTGLRRMPAPEINRGQAVISAFPQRTTLDCYNAFPAEVKASCPLDPATSIDRDSTARWLAAGPDGGMRHRPAPEEPRDWEEAASDAEVEYNSRVLSTRGRGTA